MLVGSEDFEIRIFHDEKIISEVTEVDKVTVLSPVQGSSYIYALANGTIGTMYILSFTVMAWGCSSRRSLHLGVYNKSRRTWRVKSKQVVTATTSFDLNNDGMQKYS